MYLIAVSKGIRTSNSVSVCVCVFIAVAKGHNK